MPFSFRRLDIADVVLIEPKIFSDARGYFMETFQQSTFEENGITGQFVQDNLSHSSRGALRGLHYQIDPYAQGKLVTCYRGEVYDVAVDIRKGSPTYGKWIGEYLTSDNRKMLYIPPGFAHGFCVISDKADFIYKVTGEYAPSFDRGFIWNDPKIGVVWPIDEPILSDKDKQLPGFDQAENNFEY